MFTYHYKRHQHDGQIEFEELDNAIRMAASDVDTGEAWPQRIEDERGNTVLDKEQLVAKAREILDNQ